MLRLLTLLAVLTLFAPVQAISAPQTREEALRVDAAFRTGLAALDQNAPQAAIPVFRAILGRHPDLIRVRLELGRAYFANRQWGEARREFVLALSADLPDAVRRNVLAFIRRIDARRGFDWSLDLALTRLGSERDFSSDEIDLKFGDFVLPFTVNRSTDSEIGLTFDITARASVAVPPLSGPALSVTAFAQPFAFGDHARTAALKDYSYGIAAGLRFSAPRTTTSIALRGQQRDLAERSYERKTGIELTAERRGATGTTVFARAGWAQIDNRVNDNLDGREITATLGVQRAIGGRASIGASVFGERRTADLIFEEYDRYGASVFGTVEPGLGLWIRASAFTSERRFKTPNVLFADNPNETEIGGTLRIEKNDLFLARRFIPYVELSTRRVDSGIDAFSYTENSVSVGVEKAF